MHHIIRNRRNDYVAILISFILNCSFHPKSAFLGENPEIKHVWTRISMPLTHKKIYFLGDKIFSSISLSKLIFRSNLGGYTGHHLFVFKIVHLLGFLERLLYSGSFCLRILSLMQSSQFMKISFNHESFLSEHCIRIYAILHNFL